MCKPCTYSTASRAAGGLGRSNTDGEQPSCSTTEGEDASHVRQSTAEEMQHESPEETLPDSSPRGTPTRPVPRSARSTTSGAVPRLVSTRDSYRIPSSDEHPVSLRIAILKLRLAGHGGGGEGLVNCAARFRLPRQRSASCRGRRTETGIYRAKCADCREFSARSIAAVRIFEHTQLEGLDEPRRAGDR